MTVEELLDEAAYLLTGGYADLTAMEWQSLRDAWLKEYCKRKAPKKAPARAGP